MEKLNFKRVIIFAGAFCSMFIGSGFASGQECMQYYSNFGVKSSFLGLLLFLIASLWIDCTTVSFGYDSKISPVRSTYQFYGGKIIGKIFDILVPVFLLCVMMIMCAGAGSIFEEQWGWSHFVGVGIIVLLMFISYIGGTTRLIDILGFIGPVIIICSLIACVYAALHGNEFAQADYLIAEYGGYKIANSWWYSSIQYVAFVPFTMVPFLGAMGRNASSKKEAIAGSAVGVVLVSMAMFLTNYAILSNYSAVASSSVPTIVFAGMLNPIIGNAFAVIIFLGLFTTAAPMLWTVCAALPTHKNKKQDTIVAAILCLLVLVAGQLPFGRIMNIIYPIINPAGLVWLVLSLIKQVMNATGRLHDMEEAESAIIQADENQ